MWSRFGSPRVSRHSSRYSSGQRPGVAVQGDDRVGDGRRTRSRHARGDAGGHAVGRARRTRPGRRSDSARRVRPQHLVRRHAVAQEPPGGGPPAGEVGFDGRVGHGRASPSSASDGAARSAVETQSPVAITPRLAAARRAGLRMRSPLSKARPSGPPLNRDCSGLVPKRTPPARRPPAAIGRAGRPAAGPRGSRPGRSTGRGPRSGRGANRTAARG